MPLTYRRYYILDQAVDQAVSHLAARGYYWKDVIIEPH